MLEVTHWQFGIGVFCFMLVIVWVINLIVPHIVARVLAWYYYLTYKPLKEMTPKEVRNMLIRRAK
jgi:hypothetical protein